MLTCAGYPSGNEEEELNDPAHINVNLLIIYANPVLQSFQLY